MLYFPPLNFRETPFILILAATALGFAVICAIDPTAEKNYFNQLAIWWPMWAGELWRPMTTTILHANLFPHAFFNLYCMLLFGATLENWIGSYRFAGLVILLAYVSSLSDFVLGVFFGSYGGVGLSGVVYGLFGLFWVGSRYRAHYAAICQPQVVRIMMGWFFLCFLLNWLPLGFKIANIAHGAGLVFGVLIGMAMFDVRRRVMWTAAVSVASLLVLATMVACPWHPLFRAVVFEGKWWVHHVF